MSRPHARFIELDGLRGVSILFVLIGHSISKTITVPLWLTPLLDAALGVRIFFVLSGFIITTLLLQEKNHHGSISWGDFLLRRLTKLVPGLFIFIGSVAFLSHYKSFGCGAKSYWISSLFLTEIFGAPCWALGHTWSLSVEEIFYLSWLPCFLYFSHKTLLKILTSILVIAPSIRILNYLFASKPEWSFLPQDTVIPFFPHSDLLAFGSLAAFFAKSDYLSCWKDKLRFSSSHSLLIAAVLIYFSELPFHQIPYLNLLSYLAVPLRSTFQGLVLAFLILSLYWKGSEATARPLGNPILVRLGTASYSIYLWQQIIIPAPSTTSWENLAGIAQSLFCFLAAIIFGGIFYFSVEAPAMRFLRSKLKLSSSSLTPIRSS
jgi:peptidoglycan/LPS O-acetylase OafA/YrhL